jgi:glutathione S-transferase
VEELLSDGRKYLTGDRFTAADIMLGANTAPILMPPNSGASSPRIDQIPDELRKITDELRATAAGQFVLRLYQENRPAMRPQSEIPENERGRSVRMGISDFLPLLGIKL